MPIPINVSTRIYERKSSNKVAEERNGSEGSNPQRSPRRGRCGAEHSEQLSMAQQRKVITDLFSKPKDDEQVKISFWLSMLKLIGTRIIADYQLDTEVQKVQQVV